MIFSRKFIIKLVILSLMLIVGYFFIFPQSNNSQPITPQIIQPTNILPISTTSAVLGTSSSLCHAVIVDSSDAQAVLPDKLCTPGSLNPDVNQQTIGSTICKSGYTATIRPSTTYTNKLKEEQIIQYGYVDTNMKNYEEDHLISLELGGSPSDPKNLWPEPHASYNEKDKVENYLHAQVCSGSISLSKAQEEISNNWYTIYSILK